MPNSEYEIIQYEGKPARRYENGTIRDERGRVKHIPSHVARAIQQKQKDIARLAAIEGVNEATGKKTYFESIQALFKVRAEMAMNDRTRAGNEALRIILQGTGLGQEKVTTVQGEVKHRVIPQFPKQYLDYIDATEEDEDE